MSQTPFSYAQAAKGQLASQPSPQPTSSPAPPSVSSQGKDDATTTSTAATILTTTSGDNDSNEFSKPPKTDEETPSAKSQTDSAAAPRSTSDAPSNVATNGDSAGNEPTRAVNEEKTHRSPSRTSRSADGEPRKGRKGKKSRNQDKEGDADKEKEDKEEKEPPKPVILSEAPIPTVNIWHKRREAQATKVKPAPAPSSHTASAANAAQVEDSKKRSTAEQGDAPNGTHDGTNGEKAQQRKSVDFSRIAEQVPRRNGPRGSRAVEKDDKSGVESLPPVADAALWPDVKSAVAADDGKKTQDKAERVEKEAQDGTAPSKRSKKEWVAIPYVPTVNFQTPMPQRSSKPRGGARGGRETGTTRATHSNSTNTNTATVTSPTADKSQGTANAAPAKEGRPREGSGSTRANSLPPAASKRASIDAGSARDARKPSAPAASDHPRDQRGENQTSGSTKADSGRVGRVDSGQTGSEQQSQFASRNFSDRRGDAAFKGFESFKEAATSTAKDQSFTPRDRSEGQGRGRGSYRARGGHSTSVAGHQQTGYSANGQYPVHPLPSRQSAPYSPPAHQNAFGNAFGAGSTRGGGRGNARGNSGVSSYGRVNSNGAGPGRMAAVNPGNIPYDFQMPQYGAYPAMPFPPMYDTAVLPMLTAQIEYYLSVDNLCKDLFLRKNMDSQGFVPFDLIAGFQRVKMIAPDVDHIRMSCEVSDKMDYVVGDDNVERLRLRDLWDRFVLPIEDREEAARTEGPANYMMRSRHGRPPFAPSMVSLGYPAASPTMFPGSFSGEEPMYPQPFMNGAHYESSMNGGDMNGHRYASDTQLSAAVPEFAPGGTQQVPFTLEGATTFSDEQVEKLMVMVELDKKESSTPVGAAVVNGTDGASDHGRNHSVAQDTRSPRPEFQSPAGAPKDIVWAEDQKPANLGPQHIEKRYVDLRKKAFDERDNAKAGETSRDMQTLYKFWSHFLVQQFNSRMYEEFRNCALEDAGKETPARYGLKYLLQFYNELLHGDKQKPWGKDRPVPEIINLHHQGALLMDPQYRTNGETRI